jgi:hypothetical protein
LFGYIRILQPELKIKEYGYYRGIYCGLCRHMGKCTGQCSRMTLRYDAAAMVCLRMAARGTHPTFTEKRCFLHPLTKAPVLVPCEETETIACIMAALAYHKCRDDIADERGFKRLGACLALPYFAYLCHRAKKRKPAIDAIAARGMQAFAKAEKEANGSADMVHGMAVVSECGVLFGKDGTFLCRQPDRRKIDRRGGNGDRKAVNAHDKGEKTHALRTDFPRHIGIEADRCPSQQKADCRQQRRIAEKCLRSVQKNNSLLICGKPYSNSMRRELFL